MTISFGDQVGINSLGERLDELKTNPLDFESIINNSIGSRNQKNNDSNSANKSNYVLQLNGFASSKRDDIFSVLHINIQGLYSSFLELRRIVTGRTPDIIELCETFLDFSGALLKYLWRPSGICSWPNFISALS